MKKRIIAYVTGTRADFGLMSGVLSAIQKSSRLKLNLYALGMHCMSNFGNTFAEVKTTFPMVKKLDVRIENDTPEAMSRYLSACIAAITSEFIRHKPDIALVLGDRAEILAVACACLYLRIPVAHVHGGDRSGMVDDVARQAITKLSHIHFSATKESVMQLKRLGEESWRIHVVGAPSLDAVIHQKFLSRKEIYEFLHLNYSEKYLLLTYHPETDALQQNRKNIKILLSAIQSFGLPVVVIYPNADPGNTAIIKEIERNRNNSIFRIYKSLPYVQFLSVAKHAAVWVGNSSAGIIESPSLHTPVVNVGDRQKNRGRSENIIDVPFRKQLIVRAITRSQTDTAYLRKISRVQNPWGDGHTAGRIVKTLANIDLNQKLFTK